MHTDTATNETPDLTVALAQYMMCVTSHMCFSKPMACSKRQPCSPIPPQGTQGSIYRHIWLSHRRPAGWRVSRGEESGTLVSLGSSQVSVVSRLEALLSPGIYGLKEQKKTNLAFHSTQPASNKEGEMPAAPHSAISASWQ